jgi:hypothetical protein
MAHKQDILNELQEIINTFMFIIVCKIIWIIYFWYINWYCKGKIIKLHNGFKIFKKDERYSDLQP